MQTKSGIPLEVSLFRRFEKAIDEGAKEMERSGLMVIQESTPFVPKDTTALSKSGFVEAPVRDDKGVVVEMGFGRDDVINPKHGRPTSSYAREQHDSFEWGSSHGGGKPLFLSDTFDALKPRITAAIKSALRRGLG